MAVSLTKVTCISGEISARRDLRIPFFPSKFARSEEHSKSDTECCFEVGGIKTCVEREQVDNGDEEVGDKWEAFTVQFVAVDSSTTTNGGRRMSDQKLWYRGYVRHGSGAVL